MENKELYIKVDINVYNTFGKDKIKNMVEECGEQTCVFLRENGIEKSVEVVKVVKTTITEFIVRYTNYNDNSREYILI